MQVNCTNEIITTVLGSQYGVVYESQESSPSLNLASRRPLHQKEKTLDEKQKQYNNVCFPI